MKQAVPPANSLIGDYFIARKRATALGVYSMGVTLGMLANVFGGPIAQMQGADVDNWLSGFGLHWLFGGLDWANIEGWRIALWWWVSRACWSPCWSGYDQGTTRVPDHHRRLTARPTGARPLLNSSASLRSGGWPLRPPWWRLLATA